MKINYWDACFWIKKAFYKAPHEGLLYKLENVGGLKGRMKE